MYDFDPYSFNCFVNSVKMVVSFYPGQRKVRKRRKRRKKRKKRNLRA